MGKMKDSICLEISWVWLVLLFNKVEVMCSLNAVMHNCQDWFGSFLIIYLQLNLLKRSETWPSFIGSDKNPALLQL